jgi:hypothetical protein
MMLRYNISKCFVVPSGVLSFYSCGVMRLSPSILTLYMGALAGENENA